MCRRCASLVALCLAFCVCATALGETQAGEPIALNVDYTVPVYGAKDAAELAQRAVALEAGLRAKPSLRASNLPESPFAALSMDNDGGGMGSRDTVVTLHVPSPANGATKSVADAKADAALLGQLANAQDSQEQRFLGELRKLSAEFRHSGGA